jgi:uncharacterized protein with GYD domain
VVSVIPVVSSTAQRIVGYLDPTTLGASTLVSAQHNAAVVKATVPAADGSFVLFPVPVGTYDLVIASSAKATSVMTGVPVTTAAPTPVSTDAVRIKLEPSATANATGSVSINTNPLNVYATVRALQKPFNGPTVEVASTAVDADTGAYGFALPTASPRITSFAVVDPLQAVPPAASFSFPADSAISTETAAGKYTLEASTAGLPTQTADIDLLLGDDLDRSFDFVIP